MGRRCALLVLLALVSPAEQAAARPTLVDIAVDHDGRAFLVSASRSAVRLRSAAPGAAFAPGTLTLTHGSCRGRRGGLGWQRCDRRPERPARGSRHVRRPRPGRGAERRVARPYGRLRRVGGGAWWRRGRRLVPAHAREALAPRGCRARPWSGGVRCSPAVVAVRAARVLYARLGGHRRPRRRRRRVALDIGPGALDVAAPGRRVVSAGTAVGRGFERRPEGGRRGGWNGGGALQPATRAGARRRRAATAASRAGGAFGAPEVVNPGRGVTIGETAITPSGRVFVAWVDHAGARVRVSESEPGAPLVETGAIGAGVAPRAVAVAAADDGRAVVAWSQQVRNGRSYSEQAVAATRLTHAAGFGPPVALGSPWRIAEPRLARLVPGGGALVAWAGSDFRPRNTVLAVTRRAVAGILGATYAGGGSRERPEDRRPPSGPWTASSAPARGRTSAIRARSRTTGIPSPAGSRRPATCGSPATPAVASCPSA